MTKDVVHGINVDYSRDSLFDELPVLLVNDWSDINNDLLTKTIDTFRGKRFNYDKLLLKYWVNKFKN